ncbi:LysM peptidoglycan-binding domain-containing protein [Alkaliphilus serpentinus]|uniref:LysM peptidoglycan-binding domain-containing protein n=1 Tax=Alkaliphilus serpentinus TaxID=1482731 RepID=A0A833HME0_9FIRM|nr:LysM domain-containing protein [Alkaliphilus serpentinus]KAB3527585.1 LysM peptidoglycan-binding domain-containing protein [Alkaliphilus serpentinus]
MKISKRERNLLIILLTLVFLWGYNELVLGNQNRAIESLKAQKLEKDMDYDTINRYIALEKELDASLKELENDADEVKKNYFGAIIQEDIITIIYDFLNASNLTSNSLTFLPMKNEDYNHTKLYSMSVTLAYQGSYSSLLDFMELINGYEKKIIVDSLGIAASEEGLLNGNLLLTFHGFEESQQLNTQWMVTEGSYHNPFVHNGDFNDEASSNINFEDIIIEFETSRVLLEDYMELNYSLNSSHSNIKANGSLNSNSKVKDYSLKLEYNFPKRDETSHVFISLGGSPLVIKDPPMAINLWVYSYNPADLILRGRLKTTDSQVYTLDFTNNINWVGWNQVSALIPQDKTLYPIELDGIMIESTSGNEEGGVLLLDGLEAIYNPEPVVDPIIMEEDEFIHYEVQPNDTLIEISMRFYNSNSYVYEIMRINGLEKESDLTAGKILIIPKP